MISCSTFINSFIVSKKKLPYITIIIANSCVAQVSRLILNLLPANCPLDESICSGTMESIRFHHTESSGEIEVDISRGDRGAISLGEEIHEEGR